MSSLSYRSWDIWVNTSFFNDAQVFDGYFECTILATLMVPQTIQFIAEHYEIRNRTFDQIALPPPQIIKESVTTEEGNFCIKLYESLDTSEPPSDKIKSIQNFVESLSLAVDSESSSSSSFLAWKIFNGLAKVLTFVITRSPC